MFLTVGIITDSHSKNIFDIFFLQFFIILFIPNISTSAELAIAVATPRAVTATPTDALTKREINVPTAIVASDAEKDTDFPVTPDL